MWKGAAERGKKIQRVEGKAGRETERETERANGAQGRKASGGFANEEKTAGL